MEDHVNIALVLRVLESYPPEPARDWVANLKITVDNADELMKTYGHIFRNHAVLDEYLNNAYNKLVRLSNQVTTAYMKEEEISKIVKLDQSEKNAAANASVLATKIRANELQLVLKKYLAHTLGPSSAQYMELYWLIQKYSSYNCEVSKRKSKLIERVRNEASKVRMEAAMVLTLDELDQVRAAKKHKKDEEGNNNNNNNNNKK